MINFNKIVNRYWNVQANDLVLTIFSSVWMFVVRVLKFTYTDRSRSCWQIYNRDDVDIEEAVRSGLHQASALLTRSQHCDDAGDSQWFHWKQVVARNLHFFPMEFPDFPWLFQNFQPFYRHIWRIIFFLWNGLHFLPSVYITLTRSTWTRVQKSLKHSLKVTEAHLMI